MKTNSFIIVLLSVFLACPAIKAQNQYYGYAPLNPEIADLIPQGSGKNNYLEALICLDPTSDPMLARLKGAEIVGVRCFLRSDYHQKSKGFSKILLYKGSTSSEPTEKKTNFDSGWNEILFDSPVTIDDEKVFVGMKVFEIQGNPYPFATYSPVNVPNSFFININNEKWIEYKDRGTLLIQAIVKADPAQFERVASAQLTDFPLVVAPNKAFDGKMYIHNLSSHSISSVEVEVITDKTDSEKISFKLDKPLEAYEGIIIPVSFIAGDNEGVSEPITLKITGIDDQEAQETISNTSYLYVTEDVFVRIPVIEEFTGLTCVACPFMAYYLDIAFEEYGGPYIYIAHHAGYQADVFTSEVDKELLYLFGENGTFNPAVMYDRTVLKEQQIPISSAREDSHEPYLNAINEVIHYPALARVLVDVSKENEQINCRVYGKVSKNMIDTGKDFYVSTYLLEDSLTATEYPQSGMDTEGAPTDLVERFRHNGIIRKNLCTDAIGDKLTVDSEGNFSIDYPAFEFSSGWNWTNCQMVAFVHEINKDNIRENIILNAGGNRLNEIALGTAISHRTNDEIKVYVGQDHRVYTSMPVDYIKIFNLQGLALPSFSVLPSGIYIVQYVVNGMHRPETQKIIVK